MVNGVESTERVLRQAGKRRGRRSQQELASMQGGCALHAVPATVSSERVRSSRLALFLFVCTASLSVQADQQVRACPEMLMDFECAQYQRSIQRASGEAQRNRIVSEYAVIEKERQRLCPMHRKISHQVAPASSIRRIY